MQRTVDSISKNGPTFDHDCEECIYLGSALGRDLYFCDANETPTVIGRYGNEGSQYESGMAMAAHYPSLAIAHSLAIQKGLISADPGAR